VLAQFGAKAAMYGIQPSGDRLREIAALVDEGKIKMTIDTVFTLDQVPEALAASQAGRTRGKLLIHTSSN
jgi:NADPH:quinone reductase-like Zn-dependent oxidoreductase